MEKKLTLERFQNEVLAIINVSVVILLSIVTQNPGFDFSGASITGNYHGGGPKLE